MRSIATGLALAATTLALTALPGTATASAEQAVAGGLYAPSALVLSVTGGDNATTGTVQRAVTLSCAPQASGTHPDPAGACAELRAAQGRLDTITTPAPQTFCSREWNPVTVTADGVWEGKRFSYAHTFGNPCARDSGSGTVFAF
ncbi:subtilase-type protease inhibitor [Streptomyces scopuliridis]|uniref:subtilase-type protease inhibitor n=1 Tax=Streptomyces scopuliridis TaxID=452529 RepID=UPI0036B4A447